MKRTALALIMALLLHGTSVAASAQTIKLGTLAPEGSIWHEIIRDMAEAWKTAPGADIGVRIYPGGVIGDEADMIRKMRIGQLHAAALTGAGLAMIAPEIQALQMPMMFRSDAELDYVRQRLGPRLEAILEARGFKLLTWGDAGWVHFFAQRPVVHPDDGLRMRRGFGVRGICFPPRRAGIPCGWSRPRPERRAFRRPSL